VKEVWLVVLVVGGSRGLVLALEVSFELIRRESSFGFSSWRGFALAWSLYLVFTMYDCDLLVLAFV